LNSLQPIQIFLASSNPGKLREYRVLAGDTPIELALLPSFSEILPFEETAPTFAENSAGKALYYSRFAMGTVLVDDSGLVVPALGGAPGVFSARYAGPGASDSDRVQKLLNEMSALSGDDRKARFVCVTTLARDGRASAV
jgi:XTP/dITP diphosphohydrolase